MKLSDLPDRVALVKAKMDKDVGHVIVHGRCQPPTMLREVSVVHNVLAHLGLLLLHGGDAMRLLGHESSRGTGFSKSNRADDDGPVCRP